MAPLGSRVGVAVSGGPDSVALLALLSDLAREWDLRLHVLHLDHGLRGAESDADADFVRDLAERWNLPVAVERAPPWPPGNLEQQARRARLDFYRRSMAGFGLARVAVGHTRSDQAETVLLRLARGAGASGLAGIHPVSDGGLVRPLIESSRAEVLDYLASRGLAWREDSSNRDARFRRNRVRADLLPRLADALNPNVEEALATSAEIARGEDDYWRGSARAVLDRASMAHPRGLVITPEPMHEALARHVAREAIRRAKGDLRRIEFQHVEAVRALLSGDRRGWLAMPGAEAGRWEGQVFVGRSAAFPERGLEPVVDLPDQGLRLVLSDSGYNTDDWSRLRGRLILRAWRPGDTYRPLGRAREAMLKDLFHAARIPLWDRIVWPIITEEGRIVWARRFGPAAEGGVLVREENL